jgi:NADH-quinone oxidoreductase subunit M
MTTDHALLLWLLFLPLAAAVVVALLGPNRGSPIRWISFLTSAVVFVLALTVAVRFAQVERTRPEFSPRSGLVVPTFQPEFVPGSTPDNRFATNWNLLRVGPGVIQFYIGVDGLNIWLVVLTAVLMLPSVLVSWTHITERVNEFYAWLLALQTAMMGIFLSFDIVLFYVFFELSLVPLFFLIGIWGGPERRYAARKFFIYTLTGSMITLLGVIGVVLACYFAPLPAGAASRELSFSIPRLVELVHTNLATTDPDAHDYWHNVQFWVFFALMAGFAVKVPLIPLHTWLPLAHVEAPTAGSVDLAGVLLKVGAYGFLRLAVPLAPDISLTIGLPMVTTLAVAGIVYGALCAYAQKDMKRLIAYSSVSHLGMCMLGMFTLNAIGISGSLLLMINHGLSTGALFLLIGMIYERYHTRQIEDYGGMATRLPLFGAFLVFACLTSAALPGLNGFVSEVLVLAGVFRHELSQGKWPILAVIASSGIILGAWYLFTLLRGLLFGALKEPAHHGAPITDLNLRELTILTPIAALCIFLGVYPQPILHTSEPDVLTVANIAEQARARAVEEQSRLGKVGNGKRQLADAAGQQAQ